MHTTSLINSLVTRLGVVTVNTYTYIEIYAIQL